MLSLSVFFPFCVHTFLSSIFIQIFAVLISAWVYRRCYKNWGGPCIIRSPWPLAIGIIGRETRSRKASYKRGLLILIVVQLCPRRTAVDRSYLTFVLSTIWMFRFPANLKHWHHWCFLCNVQPRVEHIWTSSAFRGLGINEDWIWRNQLLRFSWVLVAQPLHLFPQSFSSVTLMVLSVFHVSLLNLPDSSNSRSCQWFISWQIPQLYTNNAAFLLSRQKAFHPLLSTEANWCFLQCKIPSSCFSLESWAYESDLENMNKQRERWRG